MKVANYDQMMAYLKDPFNPSELRARVKELEPREEFGRTNFYRGMSASSAPKKIKLKEPVTLTGKAGDRKLTAKQIDALDPNYLGDFTGGDLERPKKVYKSGTTGSVIDDAIEIRNIIVNNKGNIFNLEELGEKAEIFGQGSRKGGKGNRPDTRKVKAALEVAKDNFPEIANFKFVTDRYKIDGTQRHQLNMVVDTIKAYQNSTGSDKLANFLPENMGMFYKKTIEKGPKKLPANPEQGIYGKLYNFGPEQIKYISDRITDETGKNFTSKDYKNLITDVKEYRTNIRSEKAVNTRATEMNKNIKKLYDDKVIQNLLQKDLTNEVKQKILDRAVEVIDDDVAVASKRLFMMAQSMAGTRPIEGITVDEKLGKKIIDTQRLIGANKDAKAFSSLVYAHYAKVVDKELGTGPGKSFLGYYQQRIKKALDSGLVPDEIFSVTASARRGLAPYAIFTQALNADVNSKIKGASLDSLLSRTHRDLQNIFQGRTYDKLNTAEKKAVQDLVTTYENAKKDVVKDLKPSIRKTIQLPEFDLKNPPSKSIANYASYDKNLQDAFDRSYKNVGYSMKVPKEFLTQKQILENIEKYENGKVMLAKELSTFCDIQKLQSGTGELSCTPDEITRNMKKVSTTEAGKARVLKAARAAGKVFGTIVAPIDIAIETALMAPHLLRGDVQGAIAASTAGFFGAGRDEIEEAEKEYGKDSPLYNLYQRDKAIGDMAMHINKMDRLSGSLKKLIPSEGEITNFSTINDPRARVSKESYTEQVLKDFIEEAQNKPKIQESFNLYAPKINTPALQFEALDQAYKLSDKIQSSGFYKPNEKGQYPLLQRLQSAGIKDLQTTFTKKDIEDRYVDMPLDKTGTDRTFPFTASELAEREKEQTYSGIRPYALKYGPEAAKEFFEAQGIDTEPYLKGMSPLLYKADGGRINFANGGRLTFSDGSPKDPSKRSTLKKIGIGGGVAGGLATGLINLLDLFRGGSKVTKAAKAEEAVRRASRAEEIFFDLVRNVKNKGVMREARFTADEPGGVIYEHAGVKVIDEAPYIRVEFETDKGAPAVIEYRKPGRDVDPDTKTIVDDPGGFEYEGQEVGRIRPNGDVDIDFEEEIIDEITNVEKIAKGE